jgi:hypothetical protein
MTVLLETLNPNIPEYKGRTVSFEGVSVQWDRGAWNFVHPQEGAKTIDTFSIWNPAHHDEIAQRLIQRQHCAMYIMGNFGIGVIREAPEWQGNKPVDDRIFSTIKQRPKVQNLVAFIHPEDAIKIIDLDKMQKDYRGHFRWAGNRLKSYAGPQHNVFPVKLNGKVDEGLIRTEENGDKTVACFWIPNHPGYEGIYDSIRKQSKHGIFGGGSLNIHGQEPSYTAEKLHSEMERLPEWQLGIEFVIFDEIAENANIGRSQAMVSFAGDMPEVLRVGSLSPEYISRKTGIPLLAQEGVKQASTLTPYDALNNSKTEQKVEQAMAKMKRFVSYSHARRGLI